MVVSGKSRQGHLSSRLHQTFLPPLCEEGRPAVSFSFFFFCFSGLHPQQARDRIRAATASLHHSHCNKEFKLCLQTYTAAHGQSPHSAPGPWQAPERASAGRNLGGACAPGSLIPLLRGPAAPGDLLGVQIFHLRRRSPTAVVQQIPWKMLMSSGGLLSLRSGHSAAWFSVVPAALCVVGCQAASLNSTHEMPRASLQLCPERSQTLPNIP